MSDLTSCEVCGMRWTAKPREMCPRCEAADLREAVERRREETARLRAELTTLRERLARVEAERDEARRWMAEFQAKVAAAEHAGGAECSYCHGVGACPRCWGRAAITLAEAEAERMRKRLGALTNAAGVLLALPVGNRYEEEALAQLKREWTLSDAALSPSQEEP